VFISAGNAFYLLFILDSTLIEYIILKKVTSSALRKLTVGGASEQRDELTAGDLEYLERRLIK